MIYNSLLAILVKIEMFIAYKDEAAFEILEDRSIKASFNCCVSERENPPTDPSPFIPSIL